MTDPIFYGVLRANMLTLAIISFALIAGLLVTAAIRRGRK